MPLNLFLSTSVSLCSVHFPYSRSSLSYSCYISRFLFYRPLFSFLAILILLSFSRFLLPLIAHRHSPDLQPPFAILNPTFPPVFLVVPPHIPCLPLLLTAVLSASYLLLSLSSPYPHPPTASTPVPTDSVRFTHSSVESSWA